MKTQTKALVVGSMTAFVGILSPATVFATDTDEDTGTCYAVSSLDATDDGPPLIVRYITENEGSLNSDAEANKFGHLKQQAFSVVGKSAALFHEANNGNQQFRIMTTVEGTIITGENRNQDGAPDEPGAHMGLDVQYLRFVNGELAIGPITLECTSREAKTTPESWVCNVKAELQNPGIVFPVMALTLPITLEKVDPLHVEACSVFQDSSGALPINEPAPEPLPGPPPG